MKTKLKLLTFLMLGFLLVSTIGLAVADPGDDDDGYDDDHDSVDDDYEYEEERDIEVEYDSDSIEIESTSRNKRQENQFEIDVEVSDNGIEIEVGYESEYEEESEELEVEEESEFSFIVTFKKVIEYVDLNDNDIYESDDVDQFVQQYALTSFKPIMYSSEVLESNNTLHSFVINTTDGVFTLYINVVEEFEVIDGVLITPMEAKIDIEISNFPYIELDSQIALYVKLESEYEYEYEEKTHDENQDWSKNEEEVKTELKGYGVAKENGFFSWADWALVDGAEQPAKITAIAQDEVNPDDDRIYINYLRGNHIFHDPKVGFGVLTSGLSGLTIGLIAIGSVAAVATIAVIMVNIRKRR